MLKIKSTRGKGLHRSMSMSGSKPRRLDAPFKECSVDKRVAVLGGDPEYLQDKVQKKNNQNATEHGTGTASDAPDMSGGDSIPGSPSTVGEVRMLASFIKG